MANHLSSGNQKRFSRERAKAVPQPAEWQSIGDQIKAAFIFARANFVNVFEEKAVNVGEACSPTGFLSSFKFSAQQFRARQGKAEQSDRCTRVRNYCSGDRERCIEGGCWITIDDVGSDSRPVGIEICIPNPRLQIWGEHGAGRSQRPCRGQPEEIISSPGEFHLRNEKVMIGRKKKWRREIHVESNFLTCNRSLPPVD